MNRSHCVKSVRIRSYSGPHFPVFGVNTERYAVSFRIQSKCGKMRIRITPNAANFHATGSSYFLSNKISLVTQTSKIKIIVEQKQKSILKTT